MLAIQAHALVRRLCGIVASDGKTSMRERMFMAMLVLAIVPIIIFYIFCQKYIIKGVVAGAVKG